MITDARKCSCGAVTVVDDNDVDSSMTAEMFEELYPYKKIDGTYSSCNYCVNHWGIDLCNCGSGMKVGECTNRYESCTEHEPAQVLGHKKRYALWQ